MKTVSSIFRRLSGLIGALCLLLSPPPLVAQEDSVADAKRDEQTVTENAEPQLAAEGMQVPVDGSVKQLMQFIQRIKRSEDDSMKNLVEVAKAVVRAAEIVRRHPDATVDQQAAAIEEELAALRFVSRFDDEHEELLDRLLDELRQDDRPEIARAVALHDLRGRLVTLRYLPPERRRETFQQYKQVTEGMPLNPEMARMGMALARSIGSVGQNELAADFYDYLIERMAESELGSLREDAGRLKGVVRRLRLPGKKLEISGTTAGGESFDWQAYRGKMVLVDFWASWCGPCRAEIPNMKRNLEAYGSDAFDIVGINMDDTVAECRRFVEEHDLAWTNLVGPSEGKFGWDHPLAIRYGVNSIPTAILVDENGVVVSLQARGEELNRILRERLGEPKAGTADEGGSKKEAAAGNDSADNKKATAGE